MRLLVVTAVFVMTGLSMNAQDKNKNNASNKGVASFYHDKFEGRRTATGEVFDNDKFTAASNNLKLGTYVKVTNLSNKEVVYVRINDRMAKSNDRLIDLASVAAKKLSFQRKGIANVRVEPVSEQEGRFGVLAQKQAISVENNRL